jgi:hypothetical protein
MACQYCAMGQANSLGNYQPASIEERIKQRVSAIDNELREFSEERRNKLLSERAKLLKAGEALGIKL